MDILKRIMFAVPAAMMLLASGCTDKDDGGGSYYPPETQNSAISSDISSSEISDSSEKSDSSLNPDESGENKTEIYDTAPIAEAYRSGDATELSSQDLAILGRASQVVEECVTDDMDDYEKELALHDWLIYNCTYDKGALRAIERPGEHAADPYGALIDGQAICMGYTTTFKLFMDMVGIECGIVHSSDTDGDEHAWNTVKLGDFWYYVDATWDDPVPDKDGRLARHTYFNITYDEMAEQHILPDGAPQTESTDSLYCERQLAVLSDVSELSEAVAEAADAGRADVAVYLDNGIVFESGTGFFSVGETYTFTDKDLFKAVIDECREAGCQYNVSYVRKCGKGNALLIIFEKNDD